MAPGMATSSSRRVYAPIPLPIGSKRTPHSSPKPLGDVQTGSTIPRTDSSKGYFRLARADIRARSRDVCVGPEPSVHRVRGSGPALRMRRRQVTNDAARSDGRKTGPPTAIPAKPTSVMQSTMRSTRYLEEAKKRQTRRGKHVGYDLIYRRRG